MSNVGLGLPTHEGVGVAFRAKVDDTDLIVLTHCVDRFWERAASGCVSFNYAKQRLARLLELGTITTDYPAWCLKHLDDDKWITLTDDIGLVVTDGKAVTCLVRRPKRKGRKSGN